MASVFTTERYSRPAVAEIDAAHGTRCEAVRDTAIALDPALRTTMIVVNSDVSHIATSQLYESGDTQVCLSKEIGRFEQDFADTLPARFVRLYQLFERLGRPILTTDAIEYCFAIELGRARLYLNHQRAYPGDNEKFLDEMEANLWSELPLSTRSSQAREAWDHNTGGYRTVMEGAGYNEQSFAEALRMNSFVYSQTKHEMLSDDFALLVLTNMHKSPN